MEDAIITTMRILVLIFVLGLALRLLSIFPHNIILGFDQARDLFAARSIVTERNVKIIGPTAGNNTSLHHGVAFLYLIIPPIFLGGGNPFWISLWLSLFNLGGAGILYLLAKSLFKSEKAGLIAATLTSLSYYFIQFAGWISNPTPTLLTVPLAFYGLWEYKQGKSWGLPLGLFFLGLSIQFELFFLYLIPVFILLWFILKPKFPDLKLFTSSFLLLILSLSTMLLTEFKFRFGGISSLVAGVLGQGGVKPAFSETMKLFLNRYFETFSLNLLPSIPSAGKLLGVLLIGYLVYNIFKSKKDARLPLLFLIIYLLSPITMLILGFHAAPWVLIGLSPAIILATAFFLSRLRLEMLIPLLLIVFASNFTSLKSSLGHGQLLLGPDASSIVEAQVAAVDYTYQKAEGAPFSINSVTNPLYINAVWAWNYQWYGEKKYGYLPAWVGGDQESPYNILPEHRESRDETIFFLITDQTPRIPETYKILAQNWAEEHGKLVEEKDFEGVKVSTWEKTKPF